MDNQLCDDFKIELELARTGQRREVSKEPRFGVQEEASKEKEGTAVVTILRLEPPSSW